MLINDFYANREVFITGGTGFLGKALIEKLLRDSHQIKVLYILLRSKRSVDITQRLEQLKQDKVFDVIRQKCPEVLNKLHAIQGDSKELGLGIQPENLKLLENVSIIFHMAANVKFDDPLRSSILLNTRGTYELIKIAENLKNLVIFMHCSTAYCNPFEDVVEEKVYDIPVDWRQAIKIAETCDENTLNALFYKYTGFYPNSYTFTKNLSEQIIKHYATKLPMILLRPSVVIGAYREPTIGWIDNINGPMSCMVAVSIGILPVGFGRPDMKIDYIAVDFVTKVTIVAAYKRGMQTLRKESVPNCLEVLNCASGDLFNINTTMSSILYSSAVNKNPMENCIWYYHYPLATGCYYNFLFKQLIMSVPLGIVIDSALRFMGRAPLMIKLCRRVIYTSKALMFFAFKEYKMINNNMLALEDTIPKSELAIYGVKDDFMDLDFSKYFENALCGVKYNFFNQPLQATPAARKRFKILFIVSRTIKVFTTSLFVLYLWSIVSKF